MLLAMTFFLALVGYAGLAWTAAAMAWGRPVPILHRCTVLVVAAHVVLVWTVRYELRFSQAVRNGWVGFLLFHAALLLLLVTPFRPFPRTRILLWIAFAVVTAGAVGAVFRYEIVHHYRIPVLMAAGWGWLGIATGWWRNGKRGLTSPPPHEHSSPS